MLNTMKSQHQDAPVRGPDGALSELTLREAVENLGMGLKNELLSLFEDDRKMKNIRF